MSGKYFTPVILVIRFKKCIIMTNIKYKVFINDLYKILCTLNYYFIYKYMCIYINIFEHIG